MRVVVAGLALILLSVAPGSASAGPTWRGATTAGLGVRGNQGSVLTGGFRLVIASALSISGHDVVVELDRQIGIDNLIEDASGDRARWHETVLAVRTGRRYTLVRGLSLMLTGGGAVVRATVTGLSGDKVARVNLGADGGAALVWQSRTLLVTVGGGVTAVPFRQFVQTGPFEVVLGARVEGYGSLAVGFAY